MTAIYSPIGADVANVHTTAQFKLGTRGYGDDGSEWVYVQASGAITQYDAVGIDEDFQADQVDSTVGGAAWLPGFAQVAFADNDYGWVATRGSNLYVRAKNVSADSQLAVGSTGVSAGVLSVSATGSVRLNGVVVITTAGSTAAHNVEIIATAPHFTA
jgi:hypothetical protein